MPYAVQTPVFEGPFDLLLHLILREQVDLYEVSLADDRRRLPRSSSSRLEELDLEVATEFLLIAATLVELKARRLLPDDDDIDLDDELALWEERDLLLARLLECKTFKDAAAVLAAAVARGGPVATPAPSGLEERFLDLTPDLLEGIDVADLRAAYLRALDAQAGAGGRPRPRPLGPGQRDRGGRGAASTSCPGSVASPSGRSPSRFVERLEVVVRFLAVLELFKQGLVDLDQPGAFGDIEIVWLGDGDATRADLAAIDAYDRRRTTG